MKKLFVLFAFATVASAAYAVDFDEIGCVIRCTSAGIGGAECGYICGG